MDDKKIKLAVKIAREFIAIGIKDARKAVFNLREHYKKADIKGVHDSATPLQTLADMRRP